MINLLLFLIINSYASFEKNECHVDSYKYVYIVSDNIAGTDLYQMSSCSQKINNFITSVIQNTNGKLSGPHLNRLISRRFPNTKVLLTPGVINIRSFTNLVKNQLKIEKDMELSNLKQLSGKKVLLYNEMPVFSASCDKCDTTGDKNIKVTLTENRIMWFTAKLLRKRTAYSIIKTIGPFTDNIPLALLSKSNIPVKDEENLFTDIKKLKFYKTNKTLRRGSLLKKSDLAPKTLVKPGKKVTVLIKKGPIELKSIGVSLGAGKIDDFVEVKNPKTKKKYLGKIIDENKVIMEI
jgi:flagella basal body P-ring formation protein FlgA